MEPTGNVLIYFLQRNQYINFFLFQLCPCATIFLLFQLKREKKVNRIGKSCRTYPQKKEEDKSCSLVRAEDASDKFSSPQAFLFILFLFLMGTSVRDCSLG